MNKIIEHLPRLTDKCRDFSRKALETFQGTPSNLTSQGHRGATLGFPGGASGKEPACQGRRHKRQGFDPWAGEIPWRRKRHLTPVVENSTDRGACWAIVHGVVKSPMQLSMCAATQKEDRA